MRLRKQDFQRRINGNLRIEFAKQSITSYSGLELIQRYFRLIGLNNRIRRAFRGYHGFSNGYSVVDYVLVLMALWFTGGHRLRHIRFIAEDPLVRRFCGLKTLPVDRSLSRWLGQFTNDSLQALVELNSELVLGKIDALGLGTITLDFDGTVLSCGNLVKWAFRGYNPMNRHSKSYFPILCHVAQTGHFLQVRNRPGNVHDSRGGALSVMKACIAEVKERFPGVQIEVRLDSAFFQKDVLRFLDKNRVRFAVKVPMWPWLHLKELIVARERWHRHDSKLSWFREAFYVEQWGTEAEMTFFRQKISENPPKNFQFDLFTPDDGTYEYSVIYSNMRLTAPNLFTFYNGRCAMEHQIAELKGEFAFSTVPTRDYQGNSAHQQISLLAYNLMRNFQIDTGIAIPRKPTRSRTNILSFESMKSLRFEWIAVAGRLLRPNGAQILRLARSVAREKIYNSIQRKLARMAA
jgi:hypothetical protein